MEQPEPIRRTPWHVALAVVAPALLGFAAGKHALLAAFDPQAPGQTALLALRAIILASVALASRPRPDGGRIVLVTAALFVGSFVAPGGILALVLVGAILVVQLPAVQIDLPGATSPRIRAALALAVGGLVVASALRYGHPSSARFPRREEEPRTSALAWLEVGNLYRARWSALAWAKAEAKDPGEAYFFIARVDHELGYEAKSRKALEKIRASSSSEAARRHASVLLGEAP